jgi:hypothetical protein
MSPSILASSQPRNIERPQPFGVGIHLVEFILQIGLHSP